MSLASYIESLQKTKTYQANLISFQEYSIQSRWLGLGVKVPKVPHADTDRHVVVMEVRGEQPNIFAVLKNPNQTVQLRMTDTDKFLFIFIEMRPHTLVIDKNEGGYRLGDGHQIGAKFTVTYQIEDAESFWRGSKDQLAEFETAIMDAARNYFLNLSSNYLISCIADLKQSLERHIVQTEIRVVKNSLEESISKSCTVAGIKLQNVAADIHIGDSLYEYLKRIHIRLYGEGGAAERLKIDQIIDSDTTFKPYTLREVINAVDMSLKENFYSMKWSDAMRLVTETVAEKRKEYMMSVDQKELNRMRELIATADELGLEPEDVKDLKAKLGAKLLVMADKDVDSHTFSDKEYLKIVIPRPQERLLEADPPKPNDETEEK